MIRKFLERRRLRRAFEKFVSPEFLESSLHDDAAHSRFNHGRIDFILAFVRGETATEVSERIARVTKVADAHQASFCQIVGALVIVVFGALPQLPDRDGSRASVVLALRDRLGSDVKIVHGAAEGDYGLFGGDFVSYTFLVPHFDKALGVLSRLEFGQTEEFQSGGKK